MKLPRSRSVRLLMAAVLVGAVLLGTGRLLTPAIYQAHTRSLLQQLDLAYRRPVTPPQRPATTRDEFIARIPHETIDWNSCRFHDRTIYDSWGTPAQVRFLPSEIELRSAGPDRHLDTPDDIVRHIPNPPGIARNLMQ